MRQSKVSVRRGKHVVQWPTSLSTLESQPDCRVGFPTHRKRTARAWIRPSRVHPDQGSNDNAIHHFGRTPNKKASSQAARQPIGQSNALVTFPSLLSLFPLHSSIFTSLYSPIDIVHLGTILSSLICTVVPPRATWPVMGKFITFLQLS